MWGSVGWGGCGEYGWIQSLLPGCAATEGGVRWMAGVGGWGEEGVGSFSLQGSPSFHRTVWHAFPEKLSGATLHLTNLILFLSSSWFLPKMEKVCLKPFGMTLRFPAFWLFLLKAFNSVLFSGSNCLPSSPLCQRTAQDLPLGSQCHSLPGRCHFQWAFTLLEGCLWGSGISVTVLELEMLLNSFQKKREKQQQRFICRHSACSWGPAALWATEHTGFETFQNEVPVCPL